jgi:molybdopterin-guanine dinucleotide biosynthesis protein A
MGRNKALLTIPPDGLSIVETVVRKVGQVTGEIVLVGADMTDYAFLGLPWIADSIPNAGPLAGIHAALGETGSSHLLVVGCDMPCLSAALLEYMASLPREYDVLQPGIDQPQPLHAIYAQSCLPLIDRNLRSARYKVSGWFAQANVQTIDRETILRHDPAGRSWFNVNTPEDYEIAKQVLARSDQGSSSRPMS